MQLIIKMQNHILPMSLTMSVIDKDDNIKWKMQTAQTTTQLT